MHFDTTKSFNFRYPFIHLQQETNCERKTELQVPIYAFRRTEESVILVSRGKSEEKRNLFPVDVKKNVQEKDLRERNKKTAGQELPVYTVA